MPPKIDFVVVLMLENRSFDHIFGSFPGANGLEGTEFNLLKPFDPQSDANPKFAVGNNAAFAISRGLGPGHSLKATNIQLAGVPTGPDADHPVKLNGFVASYTGNLKGDHVAKPTPEELGQPMKHFSKDQLPGLNALALTLVIGSGLLIRTSMALNSVKPGFDPSNVLVMSMSFTGPQFPTSVSVDRMIHRGAEELRGEEARIGAAAQRIARRA